MRAPLVGLLTALALAAGLAIVAPSPATAQWLELQVPERPLADEAAVEAGRAVYDDRCWFCHGD